MSRLAAIQTSLDALKITTGAPSTLAPTTTLAPSTTPLSTKSCAQLNWDPIRRGDQEVCGGKTSGCSGKVTLTEAREFCRELDARICTASELDDMMTMNYGCSYDFRQLWTSTACGDGKFYTYKGNKGIEQRECVAHDQDDRYVRCCADVY